MNERIENDVLVLQLKDQLLQSNVGWLWINAKCNYDLQEHTFAVFEGLLSKDGEMFDAWLIVAGDLSTYCLKTNYPTIQEAVGQHIGRLAFDGKIKLVEPKRAKRPSSRKVPKV